MVTDEAGDGGGPGSGLDDESVCFAVRQRRQRRGQWRQWVFVPPRPLSTHPRCSSHRAVHPECPWLNICEVQHKRGAIAPYLAPKVTDLMPQWLPSPNRPSSNKAIELHSLKDEAALLLSELGLKRQKSLRYALWLIQWDALFSCEL